MPYVVVKPESAEGIYNTWAECLAALDGTKGERRYMKVSSREEAHLILTGDGVTLPTGNYAFTDGNSLGGIGVVLVEMTNESSQPVTTLEVATSVEQVFRDDPLPGLASIEEIRSSLSRRRNIFAEVAAIYLAILRAPDSSEMTVVHDYLEVAQWLQGSRLPRDLALKSVITESLQLCARRDLGLSFRHQPGHRSTWAGRHDFARFNARADELASLGSSGTGN